MRGSIGRLSAVEIRKIFRNEPKEFSVWLAEPENLQILGDAVDLDLRLVGLEQKVGDFSADIVCKNGRTGYSVVIENQLDPSDHDHLGKLITYGVGSESLTTIWICRTLRMEHRAALEWLNQWTPERYAFYGVEIKLLSVDRSRPAPLFNVVVWPNRRAAPVHPTAPQKSTAWEKGKERRRRYWEEFLKGLTLPDPDQKIPKSIPLGNLRFDLAGKRAWITVYQYASGKWCGVFLNADRGIGKALQRQRHKIEGVIGLSSTESHWDGNGRYVITTTAEGDPENVADRPRQHAFLRRTLAKYIKVLRPRVLELTT
ncbi:MAG: hypothetical protein HY246_24015 [Proteobacteria bacterium]|nr:hypothetical protein [Pseudomonadota bacterium]